MRLVPFTRADRPRLRSLLGLGLLVALLVAMVLNTKFLSPEELAAADPDEFDPATTAGELFERADAELSERAAPLPDLVKALTSDTAKAAEEFDGVSPTETSVVFAVTATGTVTQAQNGTLQLKVDGIGADPLIQVPTTTAINGTVVRDALGFRFADAPGQSDFQFVGDELKKLMQQAIQPVVGDGAGLQGKEITVLGAITVLDNGGPQPAAKPVSIQPVSIQEGAS